MLTYKIQLMNGTTITANNVTSIWNDDHGIHFEAGKETAAYVPHKNLANYQSAVDKPVTSSVTTTVGWNTVTFEPEGQIKLEGPVTINNNKNWDVNEETSKKIAELICEGIKDAKKVGR